MSKQQHSAKKLGKGNESVKDHCTASVWKTWLTDGSEQAEEIASKLCSLLRVNIRLRQVPEVFSELFQCVKELACLPTNRPSAPETPKVFAHNFAECVTSLPAGQTLELWKILLDASQFLQENPTLRLPVIVELFSIFLLHIKLSESEFPTSKLNQLKELISNTTELLKSVVPKSTLKCEYLYLCYAWGEMVLTLRLYHSNCERLLDFLPKNTYSSDVFDLSALHSYLSAQQWTTLLDKLDNRDARIQQYCLLLLIQKARTIAILCDLETQASSGMKSSISKYVFLFFTNNLKTEDNSTHTISDITWDIVVPWFPLLLPYLESKELQKLSSAIVQHFIVGDLKTDIRTMMKNNFFLESRALQTSLVTSFLEEAACSIVSMKRKLDSDVQASNILKYLHRQSNLWLRLSESRPEDVGCTESDMWLKVKKAAAKLFENDWSAQSINVDRALHLIQVLWLFPLEDLEPVNQMRCILSFLYFLFLLKNIKNGRKTELHNLLCQALLGLLSKMPVSRMIIFFDAEILLQKLFQLLRSSESVEEQKWTLALVDKCLFIFVGDTVTVTKIGSFVKQLDSQNGMCALEMRVFITVIKRLLSFSKRHLQVNRVESFQVCDALMKSLVSELSKKLSTRQDLDAEVVCQSLTCILTYHCMAVPGNIQTVKRKPKRCLSQHLETIKNLVSNHNVFDCESSQFFDDLVETICKNRCLFESSLSEKFVLKVWNIILQRLTKNSLKDFEERKETGLNVVATVLKSLNPEELVRALKKLNKLCGRAISSNVTDLVKFVPLWSVVLNIDFGTETPRVVTHCLAQFLNLLLPLLVRSQVEQRQWILEVVLPILDFIASIMQKTKVTIRHSTVVLCFQACSSFKLNCMEAGYAIRLSGILLTIYKRLLTRSPKVILQAVASFLSCLTVIMRQLIAVGNRSSFLCYNESTRKSLVLCAEDFSKLLALVAKYSTEFCKQAGFLVSDYVLEVQDVTVHPLVKEQLLLGVYKILDICDKHVMTMLQISLPLGGREILRQLHEDFNHHYRYKGTV